MKKRILNLLFLSSTLLLAGCQNLQTSSPAESTPAPESTPEVESTVESTPEQNDVFINEKIKVTLNKTIYLEGDKLDVAKVEVWSDAFGTYTEKPNFTFEMPKTVTEGKAYARVLVGNTYTDVEIKYYSTVEKAVEGNPIVLPDDVSSYFNEADYINVSKKKLQFTATENNGKIFTSGYTGSANKVNTSTKNPQYNAVVLDVFDGTKNGIPSVYDETAITIPHFVVEGVDYYCSTYTPTYDEGALVSTNLMYEIITDGTGHIVYMAPISHDPAAFVDISLENTYWSIHKNYLENPCFRFAEDYNAETNPFAYQKVLPEGGQWFVGTTNDTSKPGKIDGMFAAVTGLNSSFYASKAAVALTWEDEKVEAKLNEAIVKYETVGGKRLVNVYTVADAYQSYAYYYLKALESNDAAQLAMREEVYKTLIYLKLPQVKAEPVLLDYYTESSENKVAEWIAMFATEEEAA